MDQHGHIPNLLQDLIIKFFTGRPLASELDLAVTAFRYTRRQWRYARAQTRVPMTQAVDRRNFFCFHAHFPPARHVRQVPPYAPLACRPCRRLGSARKRCAARARTKALPQRQPAGQQGGGPCQHWAVGALSGRRGQRCRLPAGSQPRGRPTKALPRNEQERGGPARQRGAGGLVPASSDFRRQNAQAMRAAASQLRVTGELTATCCC